MDITAAVKTRMKITSTTCILALVFSGAWIAHGQDGKGIENDFLAKEDQWRFMISPYALLASQSTDVGSTKLRQSFSDLSSLTNFGFQLAAAVMYRDWLLTADGTYAELGTSGSEGPLDLELGIKQFMLDLRLGYLVLDDVDYENEASVVRGWTLEVNAGAKYWSNKVTLDYSLTLGNPPPLLEEQVGANQAWWDPMIGAKARIILSRTVLLGIYASGGGFGIGNASKFSWDFFYNNTFKVSRVVLVTAGFRAFHYNRVDDQGDGRAETSVNVIGPLLGVAFVF